MNTLIECLSNFIIDVKSKKDDVKDFDEKFLSGLETQLDWAKKRQSLLIGNKKKSSKRNTNRKKCIYVFTKASKRYGEKCGKGCKEGTFCGLHKHSKQAKKQVE